LPGTSTAFSSSNLYGVATVTGRPSSNPKYWIVDEMQQAGHQPRLAHARKAKLMMGQLDKTDKLDARGLATLLRNGTLPEVWIAPREIRDQRELLRLRMTLVGMETRLKNRVHAILAKYALRLDVADSLKKAAALCWNTCTSCLKRRAKSSVNISSCWNRPRSRRK
jgi:transposase